MCLELINSLCIFCYKPATQTFSNKQNLFFTLFCRHLKIRSSLKERLRSELHFCSDCCNLGNSFSEWHFQMECAQLQLNWKLKRIYETMLCAGRVPSRCIAFRKQFHVPDQTDDDDQNGSNLHQLYSELHVLRKCILKSSKTKLRLSQPKVYLKILSEQKSVMKVEPICEQEANIYNERETKGGQSISTLNQKLELLEGLLTSIVVLHLSLPMHISPVPLTDFNLLVEEDPQECSDENQTPSKDFNEYSEILINYEGNEDEDGCEDDPLAVDPIENDKKENSNEYQPDYALSEDFIMNLESDGNDDADYEFQTNSHGSEIESQEFDMEMHIDKQVNKISTCVTSACVRRRDSSKNFESRYRNLELAWNECEVCSVILACEAALEKHRVLVHNLFNYVCCHSCRKMFPNPTRLIYHRSRSSSKASPCYTNNPSDLKSAAVSQFPLRNQVKGRLFCSFEGCYEVFEQDELLNVHLKTHGKWSCIICPVEFCKAHELAWHEVHQHPNPNIIYRRSSSRYKCSRCDCSYKEMRALTNHFLGTHLGITNIIIRKPIGTVW